MATENEFPKVDGDIAYGTEFNKQSGNFITVEAGENISVGEACFIYLKDATNEGKAYLSDANVHALNRVTGIATETVLSGADVTLQTRGVYYESAAFTDKETYYLDTTPGALSTTISAVRIGIANGTGQLMLDINQDDKDVLGTVKAWLPDHANMPALIAGTLSAFWHLCDGTSLTAGNADPESPLNGGTIPNLNGNSETTKKFLRGAGTSDVGTGDTITALATHNHTTVVPSVNRDQGGSLAATGQNGTFTSSTKSHIPPAMDVVFIMKFK